MKRSVTLRVLVMILAAVLALAVFLGGAGIIALYELGAYSGGDIYDVQGGALQLAVNEKHVAENAFFFHIIDGMEGELFENTNLSYTIYDRDGNVVVTTRKTEGSAQYRFLSDFSVFDYGYGYWDSETGTRKCELNGLTYTMTDGYYTHSVAVYVDPYFAADDQYRTAAGYGALAYNNRNNIAVTVGAAVIAEILLVVFLMCTAGYRRDIETVTGTFIRIPFDIITLAEICVWVAMCGIVFEIAYSDLEIFIALCIAVPVLFVTSMLWLMSLKIRIKNHTVLRNTVTVRFCRWCWKIVKKIWAFVKLAVKSLPIIWKTAILCVILFVAGIITIIPWDGEVRLFWMIVFWALLSALLVYSAIMLRRLQKSVQRMAAGDLNYKVDDSMLVLDFKNTAAELNNLSVGMSRAVEERMKSERFKTELITNVSHDIKTPLTSIINYADLISREPTENEKIKEYTTVLLRQSDRLKKLIVDLVEASKASTGNIEVEMTACEIGVLLSQAVGEYEQRMAEKNLTLVVTKPDYPLHILADGRQLWRVFDNLMSNICKYSMPGTRVYITLEDKNGSVIVTFRNISSYALNVDGEELTERFVRADTSRNTEGNGLGLSIAKSLTDIMGGMLNITVDGDLFKAAVFFRKLEL